MQMDFHYYATYCAAFLAGYSHDESLEIAYSSQLVDMCGTSFLRCIGAPAQAATVQLTAEIMDMKPNVLGRQELTRIYSAFHFLPYDLNAPFEGVTRAYRNKYRLLCSTNGELLARSIQNAKDTSLQAVGIAMHVLADTWAHKYFAGTPSFVINDVSGAVYETVKEDLESTKRKVSFKHDPTAADLPDEGVYINSLYQFDECSVMNLGHDRIGKLPDYSYAVYQFLPAWGRYRCILKNNPDDYLHAFCQMITAMKYLRGETDVFTLDTYDFEAIEDYKDRIQNILEKRCVDTSAQWKTFGESLSEQKIPDFNLDQYKEDYTLDPSGSFLARFVEAALVQKNMVAYAAKQSGNPLLGNVNEERRPEKHE